MDVPVYIIILTWNNISDTLKCLDSIQRLKVPNCQVIIVDNGSYDGTVIKIRKYYPECQIIENHRNIGYANGNNIGIQYALEQGAPYVFVLNNDTIVDADCINKLMEDLQANPQAAASAPKSFYYDNPDTIYFAGGRITPKGDTEHIGNGKKDGLEYSTSCDTEWLTGCAILFRREALLQIGLFEPKFFLLYEDVDWSLRARKKGFTLRVVPKAMLWHKVSRSFGEIWSPKFLYYYTRNSYFWIERNFPLSQHPRLFYFNWLRTMRRAGITRKRMFFIANSPRIKAVRQGTLDYVLRQFGKMSMILTA